MHSIRPVLNYFPAEIVATGVVAATPTTYPIGEITVTWDDSSWNDILVGQLFIVRVGSGTLVTYGVIRKSPTSTILYIDGKSRGDAGIAVSQAVGITAGHIITVYSYQPLWALLSRIKDGKFYKKFDIPYDGSGSNPSPVCNIGEWRQVWANEDTGYGRVSFDNDNSFAWLSKTITTYSWDIPGTAVVVSGGISQDSITLDLPQGFHKIRCTITDDGGASTTSFRPVWVNGSSFLPLSERYAIEIGSDSQDRTGRTMSYTLHGEIEESDFLPGTAMLFTEDSWFDSQEMESGVLNDNFAGFANETYGFGLVDGEKSLEIECSGPFAWLSIIPMVSQAIVEVSSPADWTDIAQTLGTPNFIAWYVLKHHSTFLDMFDYFPLTEDSPPRKLNWGITGSTVADYIKHTSSVFGGNAGCVGNGALYLRRDPNLETSAFRSALDVRMTITIDSDNDISDLTAPVQIPINFFNQVGQIRVFALVYTGSQTTAYASIAPGYFQMQAAGSSDEDSFILKPTTDSYFTGGQDGVNATSGHLLARENNPIKEISLALNRNMDVADPAKMLWFRLSIPAEWSPVNKGFNTRALPVSVDRSWEQTDGGGWVKNISLSVSPETFGQPGETYNIDTGAGSNYEPVPPPILEDEEILEALGFICAINEEGSFARSYNALNWEVIQGNMTGIVQDFCLDLFSPYVSSGYVEGNMGAWAITMYDTYTAQIWHTDHILAQTPTWELQNSVLTGSFLTNALRIISNPDTDGYVVASIHDHNGNFVTISTDGGSSWNNFQAGNSDIGAGNEERPCDITFHGDRIITSGYETSSGKWKLYYATSPSSGFTVMTGSPEGNSPWPMITTGSNDVGSYVYATKVDTSVETTTRTYTYKVLDSGGTPTPTVVLTGTGGTTSDIVPTIDSTPANTPILDLETGTHYGGVWSACYNVTPVTNLDGWLLKTTGQSDLTTILSTMTIDMNGYGDFITAGFNGHMLSIDTDVTSWASIIKDHAVFTFKLYNQRGQLINSVTDVANRIGEASFCPRWETDWTNLGGPPLQDIAKIVITAETYSNVFIGVGEAGIPAMTLNFYATFSSTTIQIPELYRISNYTGGSPTFTDITPPEGYVPMNPYSLNADEINSTTLNAIVTQPGGIKNIAQSDDNGDTWLVSSDPTYYYGLKQVSDFGVIWGYNAIDYTDDNWNSLTDIYGNWIPDVDDGGTILNVKAAI